MHKFKVGQKVGQFDSLFNGRVWEVVGFESLPGEYQAKVVRFADKHEYKRELGAVERFILLDAVCEAMARPEPFRNLAGRFAKPLKVTLYLREIRVVPVEITAATVEDAEKLVLQGDGDYKNRKAWHSDLSASDYFELFERAAEIAPE